MCIVLATSAFAASSDVEDLKALVNGAQGITDSQKAQAVAFLDDYAQEHADQITPEIVSQLTELYNTALATPAGERTQAKLTDYVNQGISILSSAGIQVTIDTFTVGNGMASITGSVSAPDAASVTFAGSIDSAGQAAGGSASNPAVSGGAGSVIKNTGVNVTSAAVLGIALVSVLGAAVVGVRKMGLLAR